MWKRSVYSMLLLLLTAGLLFAGTNPVKDKQQKKASPRKTHTKSANKKTTHHARKAEKKDTAENETIEREKLPPILARRSFDKLTRAVPGEYGLSSPASAQEEAFLNRAYPDTDISLTQIENARTAFKTAAGRLPRGKGRPGTWVSVGPSSAEYQSTPYRSTYSYVPTKYLASGRTPALAISPVCVNGHCRMWAGPAGGGIWRTEDALQGQPNWTLLSTPFDMNSIGTITLDPNDPSGNTIWVGTGEANSSADSAAGVGLYKSTNGGDTWTGPIGSSVFRGRAVGTIAIKPGDPNTIYAGSMRGVLGVTSTTAGAVSLIPGAAMFGLYKSTDGGNTWALIHEGSANVLACTSVTANIVNNATPCSPRGTRRVAFDPGNPDIVYASSMGRGVWRSNDAGATWTQIKPPVLASSAWRSEFAINTLPDGKTRMYVGEGDSGPNSQPYSRLSRSDDVATGVPVFTNLTSSNVADPGYGSYNYCEGQCWYDNYVVSPPGYPDIVYLLGSYAYGEQFSNKRGVVLSTDAGVSFTDMTMDATSLYFPNGIHPDQHSLVVNPNNPYQFFEGSDGGVVRSSGQFADASGNCSDPNRNLSGARLARCQQLLSRIPTELQSMNKGLTTLQMQHISVNPANSNNIQSGTQDNGTWESTGNQVKWLQTMWGDGGFSGFDIGNPQFRFHTYYNASPDVNFSGGQIADWNWIGDPIYGYGLFYTPIITDPKVSGTMYAGAYVMWRTKTFGMGTMSLAEFRSHCNEFYGDAAVQCGDWTPIGSDIYLTNNYGSGRTGGNISAVARAANDTSTLWAATTTGRLFISKNADADPEGAVVFNRIDNNPAPGSDLAPNRNVSAISVDPTNGNHAFISYNGFSTPNGINGPPTIAPGGHVIEATYDPNTGKTLFADRSYDLGDIPVTGIAYDNVTGDVYAATDFGVLRLAAGTDTWTASAPGMPRVEVAGLTIVPGARKLYAATHGLGAWLLNLP
jgi:hypothetical protein